jgi:hypothetical protein
VEPLESQERRAAMSPATTGLLCRFTLANQHTVRVKPLHVVVSRLTPLHIVVWCVFVVSTTICCGRSDCHHNSQNSLTIYVAISDIYDTNGENDQFKNINTREYLKEGL